MMPKLFKFPQQRMGFKCDRPKDLSQPKLMKLQAYWDLSSKDPKEEIGHPYSAITRNIAEHMAIEYCVEEAAGADIHGGVILDVGGNSFRHHAQGRSFVHTCNPDSTKSRHKENGCHNAVRECHARCWPMRLSEEVTANCPVISFSVHAMYYFTEDDWVAIFDNAILTTHYAVHHIFDPDEKTMSMDELAYNIDVEGVHMHAIGNTVHYHHPDVEWLKEGKMRAGKWTIRWNTIARVGDQLITKFEARLEEDGAIKRVKQVVSINGTKYDPKVVDASTRFLIGVDRERSYALNNFIQQFPRILREEGIRVDMHLIQNQAEWFTTLFYHVDKELGAKEVNITSSYLEKMEKLSLMNQGSLPMIPVLIPFLKVALPVIIGLLGYILVSETCPEAYFHACRASYDHMVMVEHPLLLGVFPVLRPWFSWYYRVSLGCQRLDYLPDMHFFACTVEKLRRGIITWFIPVLLCMTVNFIYVAYVEARKLGTDTTKGLYGVIGRLTALNIWKIQDICDPAPLKESDQSAHVTAPPVQDCHPGTVLQCVGYGAECMLPIFPRRCWHMVQTAIVNRLCLEKKAVREWTPEMWQPWLIDFIEATRKRMYNFSFNEWLQDKDPKMRIAFERAYSEEVTHTVRPKPMEESQGFIKLEKYLGKSPFDARPILAMAPAFAAAVSPWLQCFTEFLSDWFDQHHCQFFYATHTNAENVGRCFATRAHRGGVLLKNDISRWDSSLSQSAVGLAHKLYEACGCPAFVVDVLLTRQVTIARFRTKAGTWKVKVDGDRRSGDTETSGGNSVLNGIVTWHCYATLDMPIEYLMVLGDDNGSVASKWVCPRQLHAFDELMLEFGLKSDIQCVEPWEFEFCSQIMYPVENGDWVLGPKIGRVIAKTFWDPKNLPWEKAKQWAGEVALCLERDAHFVPILRVLLANLISSYRPTSLGSEEWEGRLHATERHECTRETWEFLCLRYNTPLIDLVSMEERCRTIFPPYLFMNGGWCSYTLRHMIAVDVGGELDLHTEKLLRYDIPTKIATLTDLGIPLLEESFKRLGAGLLGVHPLTLGAGYGLFEGTVHKAELAWVLKAAVLHGILACMPFWWGVVLHIVWNLVIVPWSTRTNNTLNMANKKKRGNVVAKTAPQRKQKKKAAPRVNTVGKLLRAGGALLGGAIAGPSGAMIGQQMGGVVSRLFGSGAYKVRSNTLMMGNSAPTFARRGEGGRVIVTHREYIGDISGSTAFATASFNINPGLPATFPWFSSLARMYQKWRALGMVWYFKSTSATALNSTNTALGTVIMATQYDSTQPVFTNKLQMENYEFSDSVAPCNSGAHFIECSPATLPVSEMYIRSGALPAGGDIRFNDLGVFTIATVGMQAAAVIGELWCAYEIELSEPKELSTPLQALMGTLGNTSFSSTNPMGQAGYTSGGNLSNLLSTSGTALRFYGSQGNCPVGTYMVTLIWSGSGTATCVMPTITYSGCAINTQWAQSPALNPQYAGTTAGSADLIWVGIVDVTSQGATMTLAGSGTFPSGTQAAMQMVMAVPQSPSTV